MHYKNAIFDTHTHTSSGLTLIVKSKINAVYNDDHFLLLLDIVILYKWFKWLIYKWQIIFRCRQQHVHCKNKNKNSIQTKLYSMCTKSCPGTQTQQTINFFNQFHISHKIKLTRQKILAKANGDKTTQTVLSKVRISNSLFNVQFSKCACKYNVTIYYYMFQFSFSLFFEGAACGIDEDEIELACEDLW
eukprot:TRINITY_DN4852_c0_g1_i3.p2 TRINITY_DN4852_c0_g1~~TRINITY_DN4852_c0_g1_i3.p2  ORF type:complete len:189 (-),score=-13.98 TRINITY_DN4852_c0_g1_i3:15-581(-)